MTNIEAAYATHLCQWLRSQSESHESYIRLEALWGGKELPFDSRTACFRRILQAS